MNFLELPNASFDRFERENLPTVNLVAPTYYEILHHFSKHSENQVICVLNSSFKSALIKVFYPVITDMHLAATFLTPQFRQFKFISDSTERANALQKAKQFVENHIDHHSDTITLIECPNKCSKTTFGEDSDCSDDEPVPEIAKYSSSKFQKCENVLQFWKTHQSQFVGLTDVALKVLSKSASSSLSEKTFSVAGKINRPDRAHFKPENLPLIVKYAYSRKFLCK